MSRRRAKSLDRDQVLAVCGDMPGAVEGAPFGEAVAVFKVGGKVFALVLLSGDPGRLNLKCDPDWALELRAQHEAVVPGYHANKKHWNTVELDGSVPETDLRDMIDHSYDLVVASLPRKVRDAL